MKLFRIALVAGMFLALLALPVWAQAAGSNEKPGGGELAGLTPDQRAAVKALVQTFHQDMQTLRANLRTALEKAMTDRKNGADEATLKADREAVKAAVEAIRARVKEFLTALKPLVPAEIYDKFAELLHKDLEGLKDHLEDHREGARPAGNTPAAN